MKTLLFLTSLFALSASAQLLYPQAKQIQNIEARFGSLIVDEYKWMENPTDPELWIWLEEQQELTNSNLNPFKTKDFYDRLKFFEDVKKRNQDQSETSTESAIARAPVLEMFHHQSSRQIDEGYQEDVQSEYKITRESVYGGDLGRVKIFKKSDGKLADILLVKFFTLIRWESEDTFLYNTGIDGSIGGSRSAVLRHKVGDNQADDEVVFVASHPRESLYVYKSGEMLFLQQTDNRDNSVKLSLLDTENKRIHLTTAIPGSITRIEDEGKVFVLSYDNANYGKILSFDFFSGTKEVLVPEQDFVISGIKKVKEGLYNVYGHRDAQSVAALFDVKTKTLTEVKFPSPGKTSFSDFDESKGVTFKFESYDTPPKEYLYNLDDSSLSEISAQSYPTELSAEKIHYTAANGQKAAMWIIKRKGLELTTKTPFILYGYGGFHVTLLPTFNSLASLPWLEKGGALAIASLPGSLTYGNEWNLIAKRGERIQSWDSFALAGKELISRGYTSSERLGIAGGSNGGLLVAGTLQRHPELFKAAVPMVGVLDMLNFNLFTAGKYWEWEYGNPYQEDHFNELLKISPYHNIERRDYPAVMVMTAEFDDRVAPYHSFKYAARLQQRQTGDSPVLLYSKRWGGHSSRSGSEKQRLGYTAAMYAFFAQQLGL